MKMEDYFQLDVIIEQTLHKKRSFRLRIFSVEVHNHCEFGQILNGKRHFLCSENNKQWPDSFENYFASARQ